MSITFQDLADHYGVSVVPARGRTPKERQVCSLLARSNLLDMVTKLMHHILCAYDSEKIVFNGAWTKPICWGA